MQSSQALSATRLFRFLLLLSLVFPVYAAAQNKGKAAKAPAKTGSPEAKAARALEAARQNPLELRAFLVRMPKGADLHNHLSGAVYAESWIRAAVEDGLCVVTDSPSFAKPVQPAADKGSDPTCGDGRVPASQALKNQRLYDDLVNAFSMRNFVPTPGFSGHDQFFVTFGRFGGTDPKHIGEWLDEVVTRAAGQNEQYMELMATPAFNRGAAAARELGWHDDLKQFRDELLAHGLRDDIASARSYLDAAESRRRELEHCGEAGALPGCRVQVRWVYQVSRGSAKEFVFAQALTGFEIAAAEPRVVALNFVQPEDSYTSMTDYALHMRMLDYLHSVYPSVHITLHAGELAPGFVPPDGLCCHIRLAVDQGHAERIGHGVDVMYEDRPFELLRAMAARHVMVEVNLTSNDAILGVVGNDHPFPLYRKFGVPVALSTDDEGVARIDLTHEYVRAVRTYGLHYADLKRMVRTGLEHSFLPGKSLWREPDVYTGLVPACAKDGLGAEKPSAACAAFLQASEKARQQWELEHRFRVFEALY
ncbi:MAG TPA: adenosine deaminase [Candidatus Angelobacter sp.]|nr:adenosine deaminase [Candidatus Angelobacter sp.]